MACEWVKTTLGSATDFLSSGTPSKDRRDYWGGSIPWVSAKDMKRFRLEDTEDHVTEEGAANGTKLVPHGTALLLARGMTLLNDVPICIAGRPMAFNQDIKRCAPNRTSARTSCLTSCWVTSSGSCPWSTWLDMARDGWRVAPDTP